MATRFGSLARRLSGVVVLVAVLALVPDTGRPAATQAAGVGSQQRAAAQGKDYLLRRAEYIAMRRGLPLDRPDRRVAALRELDRRQPYQPTAAQGAARAANPISWTALGPAPIPNGQVAGGAIDIPVSGRVTSIAVHQTNANTAYVGTAQGGVYRTLDGGATWTSIFDGAQSLAIGALALAPSQPTTLYVGTGEANFSFDSFFGVGVYRIDNADTTATLNGPINPSVTTGIPGTTAFTGRSISRILVHRTDPATIFVATTTGVAGTSASSLTNGVPPLALAGLYRSANATAGSPNFTKLTVTAAGSMAPDTSGNRGITDLAFDPGDATANTLIAAVMGGAVAGDGGIYRSVNALAASPTFAQTFTITLDGARIQLAVNRVGATTTMIAATEEGAGGLLRKSIDGGGTWSAALAGGTGFCETQCFYDIAVALDPNDASIIHLGGAAGNHIYQRSVNGGAAFTPSVTNLHVDVHAIAVAPSNPNIVYNGNDGGIYRSIDKGLNWTSLNNAGFNATQFHSLATHPLDREFMIGGTQDNGTMLRRPDATWNRADFGDGGFAAIDQNAADNFTVSMFHTYFNSNIAPALIGYARASVIQGAVDGNWVVVGCNNGMPGNGITCTDEVLFYPPLTMGPGSPAAVYFGTDRLYRSIDRGNMHTVVSQAPLAISGKSSVPISAIGIAPQSDNVRLVGLQNGKVFATTTGSNALTDVTCACFPANPDASGINFVGRAVIDPNNVNTAYVTFSFYAPAGQGIWKTNNLNAATPTWTAAGAGIPSLPINAFVVDPLNSNNLYAGTDIGVFRSSSGGTSWIPFTQGMPRVAVFELAFQMRGLPFGNQILRAATHGKGVWEIVVGGLSFVLGDINHDRIVDIRDYGLWRQRFGATDCGPAEDLNLDCIVDIRDYGIWRQHFGETSDGR